MDNLGVFPLGQSGREAKLITHLNRVARLRMGGAIPPLPYVLSCCGALLSTGTLPRNSVYSKVSTRN